MLQKFPYLASIDVRRDFPDYLKVEAIKREGLATFCQTGDCFIVDKEGIIFEVGDSVKPRLNVLISTDKVNLGSRVIDPLELNQLIEIDRFVEREAGVAIKEIRLVSDEKLVIETQEGWEIYLNPKGEVEWELIKLRALLTEKLSLEEREGLEWVELRFGNFANPKYKD
jgi:cell division septal protein FtsQ